MLSRIRTTTFACVTACLGLVTTLSASEITIKGSDTMILLNQKWAQEYMKLHPDVNVQVTGGGSGTGIAALRNNTTDIAAASRLIKPKETQDFLVNIGIKPSQYKVALDGVAVFVNDSNPITEISIPTLGKIFRGEITNWKQVGGADQPIVLYSRESNSGTYAFFKEVVLEEKDFSPKAQTLAGTAALIDAISKDVKGIGYGGVGYAHGVKALKLRKTDTETALAPTKENVEKGLYPLSRSLNFYVNPRSTEPEIEKFVKWVRGTDGQKIVLAVGYYPLPTAVATAATPAAPAPAPVAPAPVVAAAPAPAPLTGPEKPQVTATPAPAPVSGEMAAFTSTETKAETSVNATPAASAPVATTTSASTSEATSAPSTTPESSKPQAFSANLLTQFRSMMVERERSVMFREESVAKREESVAKRELYVAEREAALASREEKIAQVTQK